MKYKIVGVDPSGSYNEGKGTTGIAILDFEGKLENHFTVNAQDYDSQIQYWQAVLDTLETLMCTIPMVLSVEDYVLYANSAKAQINSEMETSKLIGAITVLAHNEGVKMYIRNASQVVNRWSNKILLHKKLIHMNGNRYVDDTGAPINRHCLDALRHAVHCYYFDLKKDEVKHGTKNNSRERSGVI
mgnify:CR=1 FL=1